MFLKKVVDWISNNQHLKPPEKMNEYFIEKPDELYNSSTEKSDSDEHSNKSMGGKTSVLDFSFVPQNNTFIKCKKEDSESTTENVQLELKNGKANGNLYTSENMATDFGIIDSRMLVYDADKDICNPTAKSTLSKSIPLPSPIYKNVSDFNPLTSDVRYLRSISTQTKINADRRHSASMRYPKYTSDEKILSLPFSGTTSAFIPFRVEKAEGSFESAVYGVLFVFGCNGKVPSHLTDKMNTKYILRKRRKANGLVEAFSYVRSNEKLISVSPAKHVISYPLSSDRSIIVAFKHDSLTDMFQIGRNEQQPVDFKVVDINPIDRARHGVSRFACRILVRRDGNHEARVYAAAFDSSQSIFIGESGIPFSYGEEMDGFTTNGVLIMQPDGNQRGVWREVSISGHIYPLRSSKVDLSKRPRLFAESNVLQDGTLIDLCGVTLIWRTPEGLKQTPNEEYLNRLLITINKSIPECRLLSKNSSLLASQAQWATKRACVYLSCGHVVGLTLSEPPENEGKGWSCPVCRAIGPIKELTIGVEPGFYVDREFPSYAFKPCGHVASQKTVEYWSSVEIFDHRNVQSSLCPFCGQKLNFITKYVKLTLPVVS